MTTDKNSRTNRPADATSSAEPVFVSDVIGDGPLAHRRAAVGLWVFTIPGANGTEPLIRDTDAAARLGFARPRDIRKLIERLWPENARPIQRATVAHRNVRGGGVQEYRVDEYWLTEAELLKLCARAETKVAEAVLDEMIAVYMAVRRGLLPRPSPAVPPQLAAEVDALRAAVVELQRELASGTIGPDVAHEKIVTPLRRIAALRGATSRDRKAERARLDRKLLGVAEVHVGEWLDAAIRDARKRPAGQLTLDGVEPPKPN